MDSYEFDNYIRERQNGMYNILESSDILVEFLNFKKKKKLEPYNGDYGTPVNEKEKEEMIALFEKSAENLIRIVKTALPGCKLSDTTTHKSSKKYDGVIVYTLGKSIVDIRSNYKILQSKFKNNPEFRDNDFDDVDGEELFEVLEKLILKKTGFKESDYSHLSYVHKKYDGLSISLDDDYSDLAIMFEFACKSDDSE